LKLEAKQRFPISLAETLGGIEFRLMLRGKFVEDAIRNGCGFRLDEVALRGAVITLFLKLDGSTRHRNYAKK
jgi:hypothetical protein